MSDTSESGHLRKINKPYNPLALAHYQQGLDASLDELNQQIARQELVAKRLRSECVDKLRRLPDRLHHDEKLFVPTTSSESLFLTRSEDDKLSSSENMPVGFFLAELYHTNEVLVDIGCDLLVEMCASDAADFVERRAARLDERLGALHEEHEALENRIAFADAMRQDEETVEIVEPLTEEDEAILAGRTHPRRASAEENAVLNLIHAGRFEKQATDSKLIQVIEEEETVSAVSERRTRVKPTKIETPPINTNVDLVERPKSKFKAMREEARKRK